MRAGAALAVLIAVSACSQTVDFRKPGSQGATSDQPGIQGSLLNAGPPSAPQVQTTPGNPPEPVLTGPGEVDPAVTPPVPAGMPDVAVGESATVLSSTRLTVTVNGAVPCSGMPNRGNDCLSLTMPTGEIERVAGVTGYTFRGNVERIMVDEQRLDMADQLLPEDASPIRYVYVGHAGAA
ncbi:hypothetical protein ACMA5I_07830 [Paracoccaceae bacterium GXU_MW_L88]